jgi:uracil-DNA glycosylase
MSPTDKIHPSWSPLLRHLNEEPLYSLKTQILPNIIHYPEKQSIFRVFYMPLEEIKVVVLGQDPYHGPGQATGLAFAVNSDIPLPPSLRFISMELDNTGFPSMHNSLGNEWRTLDHWEQQGVFLLNTSLSVESGKAGSHLAYWQDFIKRVVYFIGYNNPTIWMLWGRKAQSFTANLPAKTIFNVSGYSRETIEQIPVSRDYNYVLRAAHPAAECYKSNSGFLGTDHFHYVNRILDHKGQKEINW